MKNTIKTLLLTLLAAALFLSSCAGPGVPSDTLPGTEDVTETAADTLPEREYIVYSVVRAEDADNYIKALAVSFRKTIAENGFDAPLESDFLMRGVDPSSDTVKNKYEILIGPTNRPESAAASLAYEEYSITANGNKIVISGGSDFALKAACDAFIESAEFNEKGLYFDPDTPVKGTTELPDYRVLVADQLNSKVSVYNLACCDIGPDAAEKSFSFEVYNIADARLREYGGKTVLLAAYGASRAKMLDYETGEVLWSTSETANNPHAVELLPNGIIAVAASTGGEVRYFDAAGDGSVLGKTSLENAHGLLYDPESGLLWEMGGTVLAAYKVEKTGDTVSATPADGKTYTVPSAGAHDLQPLYGDKDKFWVSTSSAVYVFSKSSGTFDTSYPQSVQAEFKSVKGIATFGDGSVAFVSPDGVFKDWTSRTVCLSAKIGDSFVRFNISSENVGIYKIHSANSSYN